MAARIVLVPLSGQASGEFQRNGAMMNTVKYIAAGLVFAAINPALAQVQLPNGETTRPGVVQLFNFWGQDNGDGSGIVVGSAHQAPSGPYNIYIYTGNQPQDFIWGEVPLDPAIVPPTTVQNKCTASLAAVYSNITNDGSGPYVYFQTSINLQPWSVYVINLNCPPVPPPGGSND